MLLCRSVWFQRGGGGICPYPRCVGHPYKTGDWTEWWGACRRASGQSGPTKPPGCGPSSSSCTLKMERLGGRTAKQGKDRKYVVQLASENIPVGSQYRVWCVSHRVQLIRLFPIILNIHLQKKFNLSLKVESNQWWKINQLLFTQVLLLCTICRSSASVFPFFCYLKGYSDVNLTMYNLI